MRINEAIKYANQCGRKVTKAEIAAKIWTNSSKEAQAVNMSRLCQGKATRVEDEWVRIICAMTGVDANFLFSK